MFTNAAIYISGSFFVKGITFLTLPVFAKILSPDDFGIYASYTFWIMLNTIFVSVQLSGTIHNAYIDFGGKKIYEYISSLSGAVTASFAFLAAAAFVFRDALENLFELPYVILFLGLVQCLFIFFSDSLAGIYRVTEKPVPYLFINVCNALFNAGLSIFMSCILVSHPYLGRVYGSVLSALLFGMISFIIIKRKGRILFSGNYVKYGLKLSLPLILHGVAGIVMNRLDQMMLLKMAGRAEAGIYSFGSNFGHIIYVIYSAGNMAFIPWYFKRVSENRAAEVKKSTETYMMLGTFASSLIILILPEIIKLMAAPEYYSAVYAAPLISAGYYFSFLYTFPVNYEFFHKKTDMVAIGTALSALVNIIGNYVLIQKYESIGAACTTILAYFFLLCMHFVFAKYCIRGYELGAGCFAGNIAIMGVVLLAYYLFLPRLLIRLLVLAGVSVILLLNRKPKNHLRSGRDG